MIMKRVFIFLLSLVWITAAFGAEQVKPVASGWKAGVARVVITPDQPVWMAGYASRTRPAEGKLHDLWAKALFLEDARGNQSLLVTMDLCSLSKPVADQVKAGIRQKLGLDDADVILSWTHTHSGPVVTDALKDVYPLDEAEKLKIDRYSESLVRMVVDLAVKARQDLKPASLSSGNGVVRFQVNRRSNREALVPGLHELKGPHDPAVPVLKVADANGAIKAVLFGYACHSTTLDGYQWSGDYPGFAQLELESRFKGINAMFFQGGGADQNPMPRRSIPLARQYGRELAAVVERVLEEGLQPLDAELSTAFAITELQMEDPPGKSELEELQKTLKGHEQRWAASQLAMLAKGEKRAASYPYPVQMWRLGKQMLFVLGGEVLVDYSLQLKRIFGRDIFVMGYANDGVAYIPSEAAFMDGGYEVLGSPRVYGMAAPWKPGLQSQIIGEAVKLAFRTGVPQTPEISRQVNEVMTDLKTIQNSGMKKNLVAKSYFSGFDLAHDTYNAISVASDGNIYYVLSSQPHDVAGQVHRYDPKTDKTEFLGDLTEICGEKDQKAIAQGKSHVRFYENDGKLYFSTHVGYYQMIDGMEQLAVTAPEGYKLYPGGHFLSYDLKTGKFEDYGTVPYGEGVLTMTMDTVRNQLYAITWPRGYFIHHDLNTGKMKNLGLVSANGEGGKAGDDYRVLCRSMLVDPRDGKVYYSTAEGDIFFYDPQAGSLGKMADVSLKIDYFGNYDFTRPGSMGYNWRAILWYPRENVAYGVHGNSGYLFRFDPSAQKVEIVERITSEPSRKSGMFDQFSYGYLGFDLGNDGETIYYLTGGPIYIDGKRVKGVDEIAMGAARGLENLHLVTYHIPTGTYTDHGPIFYGDGSRPTYVNSIAIGKDGQVYTLARFEHNGKIVEDLVRIPGPF